MPTQKQIKHETSVSLFRVYGPKTVITIYLSPNCKCFHKNQCQDNFLTCLGRNNPLLFCFNLKTQGFCNFGLRNHRFQLGLRNGSNAFSLPRVNRRIVVCCSKEGPSSGFNRVEPFHGKSGSVSFYGLTYQSVEEAKNVSDPFNAKKGSLLWILGPAAFILSLILPQFFVGNAVQAALKDDLLAVIVSSLSFEIIFYVGIATFLLVTDHIQRPYLQISSKRWGLITGLSGYMTSMFLTMGLKVVVPLLLCVYNLVSSWNTGVDCCASLLGWVHSSTRI